MFMNFVNDDHKKYYSQLAMHLRHKVVHKNDFDCVVIEFSND